MESLLCFSILLSLLYCVESCCHVSGCRFNSVCCEGAAGYYEYVVAYAVELLTRISISVGALGYNVAIVLGFVVRHYLELRDSAVFVNDIEQIYRTAVPNAEAVIA